MRALLFWVPLALLGGYLYADLLARFSGLPPKLGRRSLDIATYRRAGENLLAGDFPYRDFFIEYPPGSLPFFVPPALFAEGQRAYATLFTAEMALVLVGTMVLTALSARAMNRLWLVPTVVFTAATIMLYPVAVSRYDAVVALTLAAAVFFALRGRNSAWMMLLAWASVGVGAAAKLVPALVAAPLALLSGRRGAARGFGVFCLVVALFFAPAFLLGWEGLVRSFAYHADRGLQIESLAASALIRLGYLDGVSFEFGAINVLGADAAFWSSISVFVTAALLLVTAAVMYRQYRAGNLGPGQLPRFAAAFLLAFMLGSKVLSPQYFIWLLPLIPLAAGGLWGAALSALFLAACWTTTQVYPIHYPELVRLEQPAMDLLVGRNLLLIVLWALVLSLPDESGPKVKPEVEPVYSGSRES